VKKRSTGIMTLRASHVCFLHRRPLGVASSRNENVESSIAATVPQKLRPNFDISVASLHKVRVFISHQRMHTSPFPLASACNCKQPRTLSRNNSPSDLVLVPHTQFPQNHKHSHPRYLWI
jgi:hypothetical protein